jgi:hypothetical protein
MSTVKVSTFDSNIELEKTQADLCKRLAIRFAVEELGWDTDPVDFRWATPAENKAGKDAFVSTKGKAERGIDFKIRREGTARYWRDGVPDIAVETSQASTHGWATKPNADPDTYIMFVFLDALVYRTMPIAITLTLGTCQELVAVQKKTRRFMEKKANNGYGWSENMIVTLDDMDALYATYWLMSTAANPCGVYV